MSLFVWLFRKDGTSHTHTHPGIKHALAERKFPFYAAILSANCFPAPWSHNYAFPDYLITQQQKGRLTATFQPSFKGSLSLWKSLSLSYPPPPSLFPSPLLASPVLLGASREAQRRYRMWIHNALQPLCICQAVRDNGKCATLQLPLWQPSLYCNGETARWKGARQTAETERRCRGNGRKGGKWKGVEGWEKERERELKGEWKR